MELAHGSHLDTVLRQINVHNWFTNACKASLASASVRLNLPDCFLFFFFSNSTIFSTTAQGAQSRAPCMRRHLLWGLQLFEIPQPTLRPSTCPCTTPHMHCRSASPLPWKNRKERKKSAMKMSTSEMTTALVVDSPTPLAPPVVV